MLIPAPRRAAAPPRTVVSVIVPTRNEAGNVGSLLDRLAPALAGTEAEVLFVDDSDDETPQRVLERAAAAPPGLGIRLVHREPADRAGGLGTAVVAGFAAARGEWLVVMDGDLQHPPELVPQLVERGTEVDAPLVVASRKVEGGDSGGLAGPSRVLVSGGATLLAKALFPIRLRGISDPMSGFFGVRRDALDLTALRPDGFKILLEILVRSPRLRTAEVGFVFQDRLSGDSKASMREGFRFARHVTRLSVSRLLPSTSTTGKVLGFIAVGASGLVVNTLAMWVLADPSALGMNYLWAAVLATQVSTTWNFVLIDRGLYPGAKARGPLARYIGFSATNNLLLLLRVPLLALLVSGLGMHYLLANLLTLVLTFVARFLTSDRLIFQKGTPS